MAKDLIEQLNDWHRKSSYGKIVDKLEQIPPEKRDYTLTSHLARAYNNLSRYEEALELLLSVAEQGADDPLWHFRTGYAYYYLNRYEEAIAAFELADRLDPSDELTLKLLKSSRDEAERLGAIAQATRLTSDIPLERMDFSDFWEDSDYARDTFVSEPPTDELIAEVEEELGYKLPAAYIHLMKLQNGGIPRNTCFPTQVPTSWADDHIAIEGIMGIGRDKSNSLCGEFGSRFMIEEWGYPDIGVVFCDCPSAGHDVVMLDYRACGPQGEPQVVHVDQEGDYRITFLASSFEEFVRGLVNEEAYDTSAVDAEQDLLRVTDGQFTPLLAELCGNVTELESAEELVRAVCRKIVEEKGFFSLHADRLSMLMYDVQFWLYTKTYPRTDREAYLARYPDMLVFGTGFATNGYAPGFVSDWLDERLRQGLIVSENGGLRFTDEAAAEVIAQLQSEAAAAGGSGNENSALEEELAPFKLIVHDNSVSVILDVGEYKEDLFRLREDEGFEGNGYDWMSLAVVFLEERMPELCDVVEWDPEGSMFCAYSDDREAIVRFARAFKAACENDALIRDLFSRAELD